MSEAAAVEPLRPPRRTQVERREKTHARLLDAAVDCLAELGYQGTTMPEVARRAGLSNGAMWRHFRSKSELLVAAAIHCEEKLAAATERVDLSGLPPRERLEKAIDLFWDWVFTPAFQGLVELLSISRADDEIRNGLLANDTQAGRIFFDAMARLVGPQIASGENFEHGMRLLGVTLYGVALTASLRTPAADLRLRAEVRRVLEMLFGLALPPTARDIP